MTKHRVASKNQSGPHAVRDDPRVHIEGSTVCGTETLCGYVDTFTSWDDHSGSATCRGCLDVVRVVRELLPSLTYRA